MAANPISYTELEAYERKALVTLSAWETDLIMRLDDTVLDVQAAKAKAKSKAASPKADEPEAIPINDTKSIRGVFAKFPRKKKA